jgi:hypothetical protein
MTGVTPAMDTKSMANGSGSALNGGPDTPQGSPVPPLLRDWEVLTARATTTSFWELV